MCQIHSSVVSQIFVFQVYVEYVVRNPLIDLHLPIKSLLFGTKLEEYLTEYGFFTQQKLNVWDLFIMDQAMS